MIELQLSQKGLAELIGKEEHSVGRFFKNPDKIKLDQISAIAEALGAKPLEYDEYIVRVSSQEELDRLIRGRYPCPY